MRRNAQNGEDQVGALDAEVGSAAPNQYRHLVFPAPAATSQWRIAIFPHVVSTFLVPTRRSVVSSCFF